MVLSWKSLYLPRLHQWCYLDFYLSSRSGLLDLKDPCLLCLEEPELCCVCNLFFSCFSCISFFLLLSQPSSGGVSFFSSYFVCSSSSCSCRDLILSRWSCLVSRSWRVVPLSDPGLSTMAERVSCRVPENIFCLVSKNVENRFVLRSMGL